MSRSLSRTLSVVAMFASMLIALPMPSAQAVSTTVVISQVYGGGGNAGATYTHDFVELFNRGTTTVDLAGWSIQYASATGTGNFGANYRTDHRAVRIPGAWSVPAGPGGEQCGGRSPAADARRDGRDADRHERAGAGKVALVNTTTPLGCNGGSTRARPLRWRPSSTWSAMAMRTSSKVPQRRRRPPTRTPCSAPALVASTPTTTAPTSPPRHPAPRNTASPLNPCAVDPTVNLTINDVSANEGNSGTTTFDFTVSLSAPAGAGGVTFDVATADGTATAPSDYASVALVGQSHRGRSSPPPRSASRSTATPTVEPDETFFVNVTNVVGATVVDGQGEGTIVNDDVAPRCSLPSTTSRAAATRLPPGTFTVEAIVVGDYQTQGSGQLRGFFVQEEDADADADPATSEGIFVFCTTCPVRGERGRQGAGHRRLQ